jgi:uncharacterized membrane-anchored protein YjiN (DUF445 family)
MPHSLTQEQVTLLQSCFSMAQELAQHKDADRAFTNLKESLSADPATIEMIEMVWKELLTARRSGAFWQQASDVERSMTESLANNHLQLQQNYLRLVQEQ